VAQRSRELAVRAALGAAPSDILRLVVGQGLSIAVAGLIVGLAAAAVLARSMSSFLYGVTPLDGPTYLVVPLFLLGVATVACLAPARRAIKVDPVQVLRSN
jgi:ABC-type lipoprotein release transport system permease subunit